MATFNVEVRLEKDVHYTGIDEIEVEAKDADEAQDIAWKKAIDKDYEKLLIDWDEDDVTIDVEDVGQVEELS